jgi:hypothetical protein
MNMADIVVSLDPVDHRGHRKTLVRVDQTPGMSHAMEAHELIALEDNKLTVDRYPSPLRRKPDGSVAFAPVRLFVHVESDCQRNYYRHVVRMLRATLSTDIKIENRGEERSTWIPDRDFHTDLDEIEIVQLDEFELASGAVHSFDITELDMSRHGTFDSQFLKKVVRPAPIRTGSDAGQVVDQFVGVPFYDNLSFLVHHRARCAEANIDTTALSSWPAIAELCQQRPDTLVFDFPQYSDQNFNCLFLEILQSLAPRDFSGHQVAFDEWLSDKSLAVRALQTFHAVGNKAYKTHREKESQKTKKQLAKPHARYRTRTEAMIWRHWFSTFRDFYSASKVVDAKQLEISSLPGETSTSGDWYLAVPLRSAAPGVALETIKALTSPYAELSRFYEGVGLPTRSKLFGPTNQAGTSLIAPQITQFGKFDLPVFATLRRLPIQRSLIRNYGAFSRVIAVTLKDLLEQDAVNQAGLENLLSRLLENLRVFATT